MKKTGILFVCLICAVTCLTALAVSGAYKTADAAKDITDIEGRVLHYDAQSVRADDGQKINVLENLADEARSAVQSDEARQPVFDSASRINGYPAIVTSTNTVLEVENSSDLYLGDMTIFAVLYIEDLPSHAGIVSREALSSPWRHNFYFLIENGMMTFGWSNLSSQGTTMHPQVKVAVEKAKPVIITARRSGAAGSLYINGILAGSFAGGTPSDPKTPVSIGGFADTMKGDMGEIILYDRALSDSGLNEVWSYLENRWGMENSHDGMLTSVSVDGKELTAFRPDVTDYVTVIEESGSLPEITYKLWNENDRSELLNTENGAFISVISAATGKRRVYSIEYKMKSYEYNAIRRTDTGTVALGEGFWSDLYKQYFTKSVNFMFDMYEKSLAFDNFDRVAAGQKKVLGNTDERAGQILKPADDRDVYNTQWNWATEPWREGLIYQGIRAASEYIMNMKAYPAYAADVTALLERLDGYVARIYAAVLKTTGDDGNGKPIDGYFSTYNILDRMCVCDETDVTARYHHDLYNYGCLVEAAIYYYNATGDTRLLFAATRFTEFIIDYIEGRDGFEGYKVVPPHELSEEALYKLYELYTDNPALVKLIEEKYSYVEGLDSSDRYYKLEIRLDKYAEIAVDWIAERGNAEGRYNFTSYGAYAQDDVTYDKLIEASGHAVRANLYYSAMAYIGNRTENDGFTEASERIWRNITERQMYVTGGTGSTNDGEEAYGGDYNLPHNGYCETCASVAMAFYGQHMFELFGTAEYIDNVELQLYNGILGCMGLDGTSFYYTNPMVSENYIRPMFSNATPCCVPMYLKFFAELPEIIYSIADGAVFINQYISSTLRTDIDGSPVRVIQKADMPLGDSAAFTVIAGDEVTLKFRLPSWTEDYIVFIDGEETEVAAGEDGYMDIVAHKGTTEIRLQFRREVMRVYQNHAAANAGRVAFKYGAIVYCAESVDNIEAFEGVISVPSRGESKVENDGDTFKLILSDGETVARNVNIIKTEITVNGKAGKLTLIPFYLRGNRGNTKMQVWFNEV